MLALVRRVRSIPRQTRALLLLIDQGGTNYFEEEPERRSRLCTRVGVMRASCISPVDRISRPALVRQSSPAGAPQNEHRMRNRCSMRCLRIARHFSSCAGVLITSPWPSTDHGGGKRARCQQLPFPQPMQTHRAAVAAVYATILSGKRRAAIQTAPRQGSARASQVPPPRTRSKP